MKETEQTRHLHLEALHHLMDVPFREELGTRVNKEQVLSECGFCQGTNVAIRRIFHLTGLGDSDPGLSEYLSDQLADGRFVAMLFKDNKWDAVGGSPVTYIMDTKDFEDKLSFNNGLLQQAKSHSEDQVVIDHSIELQTYSRRRSMESEVSGFTNYDGKLSVRLGGGFRLQVDNLTFIDGKPHLTISGYFSFNDMGSRVLALSCNADRDVPRYETSFLLQIDNGQLQFEGKGQSEDGRIGDLKDAGAVVEKVLHSLFERDGEAVSKLIRGLLSVRPTLQVHQLEGIFSIPEETEISAEVIDFDGIDSFDLGGQSRIYSPGEKLVQAQLRDTGYLLSNSENLLSFISFRKNVREAVDEISNMPNIPQDIKLEAIRHLSNPIEIFTREQTGAVKLGRLFNLLNIDWDQTDSPAVKTAIYDNDTLTMVSIEGFDLGFWNSNSGLVDCSDIHSRSSTLSKMIGREILPVHLSSLREGD